MEQRPGQTKTLERYVLLGRMVITARSIVIEARLGKVGREGGMCQCCGSSANGYSGAGS